MVELTLTKSHTEWWFREDRILVACPFCRAQLVIIVIGAVGHKQRLTPEYLLCFISSFRASLKERQKK